MFKRLLKSSVLRLALAFVFLTAFGAYSQKTITGTVRDASDNSEIIGATVQLKGTTRAVSTDVSGNYKIEVPNDAAVLVFSFVGMTSQEVTVGIRQIIDIILNTDIANLDEVIVIGYGSQKKKDLTGSITSINTEDFVKGQITTPEQLISGKVAGVQITSNGGAPGAGSTIRIRGGSSLLASNDPLIVIDGMPLDNSGISGSGNPLAMINPNDIETFTVLKDASAAAIYGSRASNGVILITTKKGASGKMKVNFNTQWSSSTPANYVDVLNADEFRDLIINRGGGENLLRLLGSSNTNWQKEIYQNALTADNNLSLSGSAGFLPYRLSVGYLSQEGILKTSKMNRTSVGLGLSPTFFNNHLKVDGNWKTSFAKNFFANTGAIGSALVFDPTQGIYSGSEALGGYFEWLDPASGRPNTLAPQNPVGQLMLNDDRADVTRSIANIVFDYKFHGLPDLRANLNLGLDKSASDGSVSIPENVAMGGLLGVDNIYTQDKMNKTMEFYLNYTKELTGINSSIDLMGGHSYQNFYRENYDLNKDLIGTVSKDLLYKTRSVLMSFYGRGIYNLADKYLLTLSIRRDGSSKFANNKWGTFPSAAFAWRISNENFLKNSETVSDLKLRLGYGLTGQQDIFNDYPALARYTVGQSTAAYQMGNEFVNTLRPEGYDANLKWESTTTANAGLDWAIRPLRLSGSFDIYDRQTKDLLLNATPAAGSNLSNSIISNVGNIENKGIEFNINYTPILTSKGSWDIAFNFTRNINKVTNLTTNPSEDFIGILTGGISGGVGNTVQIHSEGYPANSFYLYQQVYNQSGAPLEGVYVDRNLDGVVNTLDYYRFKSPNPDYYFGISSQFNAGKWFGGIVTRGNIGNYLYNNVNSNSGIYRVNATPYLTNVVRNAITTGFGNAQYFSDYYLENGSFFRIDNINAGYHIGSIRKKVDATLSFNVSNVGVITKYSGLDPEISGGIDDNIYPRPRTFTFGLNLGF